MILPNQESAEFLRHLGLPIESCCNFWYYRVLILCYGGLIFVMIVYYGG